MGLGAWQGTAALEHRQHYQQQVQVKGRRRRQRHDAKPLHCCRWPHEHGIVVCLMCACVFVRGGGVTACVLGAQAIRFVGLAAGVTVLPTTVRVETAGLAAQWSWITWSCFIILCPVIKQISQ